ncbi:UNVERIFIED_CONTAM: hypothetical protein PYX00_006492 [Menopon gallinae]|uniref:Uncharacterized protein n=1 Tax=Menopon gallinae TaxID=328185 RepID=A0AAW2HVX9_9NEOP
MRFIPILLLIAVAMILSAVGKPEKPVKKEKKSQRHWYRPPPGNWTYVVPARPGYWWVPARPVRPTAAPAAAPAQAPNAG